MSGPIKKGDLVMVVKPTPCCGKGHLGLVLTVDWVRSYFPTHCRYCGADRDLSHERAGFEPDRTTCETYRLKKIDPPATGEYDRVPVRKTEPRKVPV